MKIAIVHDQLQEFGGAERGFVALKKILPKSDVYTSFYNSETLDLQHQPHYLYYYETAIECQKYLPFKIYGNLINHDLRLWDFLSSQRVDYFIANSEDTKKRIQKFYRRDSTVIYPPVNI